MNEFITVVGVIAGIVAACLVFPTLASEKTYAKSEENVGAIARILFAGIGSIFCGVIVFFLVQFILVIAIIALVIFLAFLFLHG